ncbi:hypothetical protein CDD81_1748 [Ophiocordyceps australis]|uniref:Uncharacterized protein n=1 Tax=Ophiocordyceps australis TaxID=1399860 RepID=A0A2C5YEE9_9HYPO|nr:hypothetical protein CDD81_1748 [Ophiocordyceps australis]
MEPNVVYRGDSRSPEEIKADGGFKPSHLNIPPLLYQLSKHFDYLKMNHGRLITPYISTTSDFKTALGRSRDQLNDNVAAYSNAEAFMNQKGVGDAVGWTGKFPLFKDALAEEKAADLARVIREAQKAADQAAAAGDETNRLLEAVKAAQEPNDALARAAEAAEAAKRAVKHAKEVASYADEQIMVSSKVYYKARDKSLAARHAAALALSTAYIMAAKAHVKKATNIAKKKKLGSARQALEWIAKVEDLRGKYLAKVASMIHALHAVARLSDEVDREMASKSIEPVIPSEDNVWAENRQWYDSALHQETAFLRRICNHMRNSMDTLSHLTAKAEKAATRSQRTVEKKIDKEASHESDKTEEQPKQSKNSPHKGTEVQRVSNSKPPHLFFYGRNKIWPTRARRQGGFYTPADALSPFKVSEFTLSRHMVRAGTEVAVAGGIVWPQVMSWLQVPEGYAMPKKEVRGRRVKHEHFKEAYEAKPKSLFQKNPDYDAKFDPNTITVNEKETQELMGSRMPRRTLTNFMAKNGKAMGFTSKFPVVGACKALPDTTHKRLVAATPSSHAVVPHEQGLVDRAWSFIKSHAVAVALLPGVGGLKLVHGLGEADDAAEFATLSTEAVEESGVLAEQGVWWLTQRGGMTPLGGDDGVYRG